MTTETQQDESKHFGFELKEAYKIALKFYKGKVQFWHRVTQKVKNIEKFQKGE